MIKNPKEILMYAYNFKEITFSLFCAISNFSYETILYISNNMEIVMGNVILSIVCEGTV